MMRAVVSGLVLLSFVLPSVASGKPTPGDFGIGIVAGEPSGLSGKVFVDDVHAFAAGFSFSFVDDTMHVQGDYLIHFRGRLKGFEGGDWIPYFGVGGSVGIWQRKRQDDAGVSARFPGGLTVHLDALPIDLFVELAPAMLVIPETRFDLQGALGGRYYF